MQQAGREETDTHNLTNVLQASGPNSTQKPHPAPSNLLHFQEVFTHSCNCNPDISEHRLLASCKVTYGEEKEMDEAFCYPSFCYLPTRTLMSIYRVALLRKVEDITTLVIVLP